MLRLVTTLVAAAAVVATGAFGVSGGDTITTIAGNGGTGSSGDNGPAKSAQVSHPTSVAVDRQGNVYIATSTSYRVRKVAPDGTITTFAGTGAPGFGGDGGPATSAQLSAPLAVAVDRSDNVYVVDGFRVRKVSGGTITTIAGVAGTPGVSGDNGPATSALLNRPAGLAVADNGDVYIADTENSRVRKVSGGIMTTIAGTGRAGVFGFSGDGGPATSAQLYYPVGVAVDAQGDVYIADTRNNRIRKVSGGTITTIAGTGKAETSGDDGPPQLASVSYPAGVTVDRLGDVYISTASRVRKMSGGKITTVAGTGTAGFGGDNGPARSAQLGGVVAGVPWGTAVDGAGNLYIADYSNARVRKVSQGTAAGQPGPVTGTPGGTVLVNGKRYTGGAIPYGSKVDVTKGKVTLNTDLGTLTASGGGGITAQFIVLRSTGGGKPIVELRLTGGKFGVCTRVPRTSSGLTTVGKKPPTTVRRLFTKGQGSFRTHGRYASATIRGTDWQTADRCDGTFVKTRLGVVAVLDLVRQKTVPVRAGQSYLAKRP